MLRKSALPLVFYLCAACYACPPFHLCFISVWHVAHARDSNFITRTAGLGQPARADQGLLQAQERRLRAENARLRRELKLAQDAAAASAERASTGAAAGVSGRGGGGGSHWGEGLPGQEEEQPQLAPSVAVPELAFEVDQFFCVGAAPLPPSQGAKVCGARFGEPAFRRDTAGLVWAWCSWWRLDSLHRPERSQPRTS